MTKKYSNTELGTIYFQIMTQNVPEGIFNRAMKARDEISKHAQDISAYYSEKNDLSDLNFSSNVLIRTIKSILENDVEKVRESREKDRIRRIKEGSLSKQTLTRQFYLLPDANSPSFDDAVKVYEGDRDFYL